MLRVEPASPTFTTAKHGEVASIDAVATWDADSGNLGLFVVVRNPAEPVAVDLDLAPIRSRQDSSAARSVAAVATGQPLSSHAKRRS